MPDFCGSCKAPVVWAISPAGRPSPMDATPGPGGNTLVLAPSALGGQLLAVVLSKDALELARQHSELYTSHWATCVDRREWRERTDAKREAAAGASDRG